MLFFSQTCLSLQWVSSEIIRCGHPLSAFGLQGANFDCALTASYLQTGFGEPQNRSRCTTSLHHGCGVDLAQPVSSAIVLGTAVYCPSCERDIPAAEWKASTGKWADLNGEKEHEHWYLANDLTIALTQGAKGDVDCLHLNGYNITAPSGSPAIYVTGTMSILGDGIVQSSGTGVAGNAIKMNWNYSQAVTNIYGGTYTSVGSKGSGAVIGNEMGTLNVYSGTIDGYILLRGSAAKPGTANIYGGTFTDTTDDGNSWIANTYEANNMVTAINIYGGNFEKDTFLRSHWELINGKNYGITADMVLNVTGGTFAYDIGAWVTELNTTNANQTLTGIVSDNGDGTWTVAAE